jgi:hypothetical protein
LTFRIATFMTFILSRCSGFLLIVLSCMAGESKRTSGGTKSRQRSWSAFKNRLRNSWNALGVKESAHRSRNNLEAWWKVPGGGVWGESESSGGGGALGKGWGVERGDSGAFAAITRYPVPGEVRGGSSVWGWRGDRNRSILQHCAAWQLDESTALSFFFWYLLI